jgi:hypothetical protein
VADEDTRRLAQVIVDYLGFLSATGNPKEKRLGKRYGHILIKFLIFTVRKETAWKDMFSFGTLMVFRKYSAGLKGAGPALISLSRYLNEEGRIDDPGDLWPPDGRPELSGDG